jgi:hypothetical protein
MAAKPKARESGNHAKPVSKSKKLIFQKHDWIAKTNIVLFK